MRGSQSLSLSFRVLFASADLKAGLPAFFRTAANMEIATVGFISSMPGTAKNPDFGECMVGATLLGRLHQYLPVPVLVADFSGC